MSKAPKKLNLVVKDFIHFKEMRQLIQFSKVNALKKEREKSAPLFIFNLYLSSLLLLFFNYMHTDMVCQ